MLKRGILLVMIFLFTSGYAGSSSPRIEGGETSFSAVVAETQHFAKSHVQDAYNNAKSFKPENTFNQYSSHPPETSYYGGVTQTDTGTMNDAAIIAMNRSDILNSINQRPQYAVNPNEPGMQHSLLLQSEADHIVHGVTDQYIDCKPKQACQMQYITQQCSASSLNQHPTCRKNLIINARNQNDNVQTITTRVQVTPRSDYKAATVTIDLTTAKVIANNSRVSYVSVTPLLQNTNCNGQISLKSVKNNNPKSTASIQIAAAPSCTNHFQLSLKLLSTNLYVSMDVSVDYQFESSTPPDMSESWSNDCNYFEQLRTQGLCQYEKPDVCVSGQATHIINGIPVTRPCWAAQSFYQCNSGGAPDDCGPLQNQGCEQIGSVCQTKIGDVCVAFKQTYRCQQQACVNTADVVCGDGQDYCLDGNCTDHRYQSSQDFAKGVSALSAAADASKTFDMNSIFKGTVQECRDDALNFSNCCNDKGWGQDINLAHCSDEEKALGPNRENGLTVYVGRYCSSEVLGVCTEHKEAYCVFDSKLARIIQDQGRKGQLHIGLGDGKHANCRGVTPDELQKIDFSKVDFSDFYSDLSKKEKMPDLGATQKSIEQHIQQFSQSGQPNA